MSATARIESLEPPFDPETEAILAKWMPPNASASPLALFRTIARHPMLRERMRPLASGLLARGVLPPRVRELLILRTCARCHAPYEWGVHVTAYAAAVGLDETTVRQTAALTPDAIASDELEDALAIRIADELHDTGTMSEPLYRVARIAWGEVALLEAAAVAGFYHLISFLLGVAGTPGEPWAAPFPGAGAAG